MIVLNARIAKHKLNYHGKKQQAGSILSALTVLEPLTVAFHLVQQLHRFRRVRDPRRRTRQPSLLLISHDHVYARQRSAHLKIIGTR